MPHNVDQTRADNLRWDCDIPIFDRDRLRSGVNILWTLLWTTFFWGLAAEETETYDTLVMEHFYNQDAIAET